jgi:hypothetical protein
LRTNKGLINAKEVFSHNLNLNLKKFVINEEILLIPKDIMKWSFICLSVNLGAVLLLFKLLTTGTLVGDRFEERIRIEFE